MTNLYDFLRQILAQYKEQNPYINPMCSAAEFVRIKPDEAKWLEQFLEKPEQEIHFFSRQVGEKNGEPIYSQHYAISGAGVDVFGLLTEAMLQNATFASQVVLATRFFFEHLPFCESCKKRYHAAEAGQVSWIMSPHKPLK